MKKARAYIILSSIIMLSLSAVCVIIEQKAVIIMKDIFTPRYSSAIKMFIILDVAGIFLNILGRLVKVALRSNSALEIRNIVFSRVMRLKSSVFKSKGTSEMLGFVESVDDAVGLFYNIIDLVVQSFSMIVVLYIIYTYQPTLLIASLLLSTIFAAVYSIMMKKLIHYSKMGREYSINKNRILDDGIRCNSVVKSFSKENVMTGRYCSIDESYVKCMIRKWNIGSGSIAIVSAAFTALQLAVMLVWVINYTSTGVNESSTYYMLVMIISTLVNNICSITDTISTNMPEGVSAILKLKELFKLDVEEDNGKVTLSSFESNIRIKNLSFMYDDSLEVLSDVNLCIHKGEKIGIVGRSGCGKSTLVNLLMRFYEPTAGQITIDNIDISEFTLESLRRHIGIVNQDICCFDSSIMENIRYGRPSATDAEVLDAARKAGCDFVTKLPDGFNTNIGPNGTRLSGGERQRVNIARLFLADPDIIILDEATSALDNESEAVVQSSIDSLSKGKTVIAIAHRLSTIKDSDRIYIIDNHKIAEEGTHHQLVEAGGIYSALWQKSQSTTILN